MTVFKFHLDDDVMTFKAYETMALANSAGNTGLVVKDAAGLQATELITSRHMLHLYNALTGEAVAKFSDRDSAVRRLWKVLFEKAGVAAPKPEEAKKPDKVAKAAKPTSKTTKPEKDAKKAKPAKGPKDGGQLHSNFSPITGTNPYRIGSGSHKSFDIIKANPSKTPAEWIKMGCRPPVVYASIKSGVIKKK